MQARTIYQMFQETVRQHGARPAVGFKEGKADSFTYWSYTELAERVRRFRRGLAALGFQKGDRIALISHENQVGWAVTDLAAQSLGLITVPIYGTLPAAQVAYYLRDSGARGFVVSDAKQVAKAVEIRPDVPTLETVIAMQGEPETLERQDILPFETVYQRGEADAIDEAALDAQAAAILPDDIATVIYTSGTTGDPKGAMLSHTNLLDTPEFAASDPTLGLTPNEIFLSFLPLSHITERVGGHYLPLRLGACIVYSQGLTTVASELQTTVRPTAMLCVPRLYENMAEKAKDGIAKMPESTRKKVEWALEVGMECARRKSEGHPIGLLLGLKRALAEKLIFPKIRKKVTGGRLRYFVSGGAPLDPVTATFFLGIGVDLLEGYGLSETSIIAINRPGKERIGTVGTLLPGVELKFAEDGEILMRGPGRMKGYWNKPDATAEAIDSEGWFHTGDIGELSPDGYLKITDRKKDILVLANGKKVAPQPIEALLKHSPYIQEAVLFGDKQPTVMAILVPAFDKLLHWARSQELPTSDVAALVASPEVQKLFRAEIERATPHLADFEKIKRFKVVSQPFGIESGELTPTLKVKRKFVAEKYADLLAAMSR
jgi:long-chain acyl-CoA synthetase